MDFLPYYVLLGIAVGFLIILVLQNLRLALQYLLTVGKVAVILFLLMLAGWIVGLWELPRPVGGFFLGLRRVWEPFQENLLDWLQDVLR